MADVRVTVAGRDYVLACAEGEEDRLRMLANLVDSRAASIQSRLSHVSDTRLMLMTAILIADEMAELQESDLTGEQQSALLAGAADDHAAADERIARLLERMADRAEGIAQRLRNA